MSTITSISAGAEHSLIILRAIVYRYGRRAVSEPEMLDATIDKVSAFEAIKFSSYILHSDGIVEACGKGDFGQLGDGT